MKTRIGRGDRVLGHCREGAQDADRPGGRSAFDPEHVVDQGEGVTAAQLAHRPVLQGDALDLYVGHSADAVVIRRVRALGSRVALGPGGGVVAQGVRSVREAVCLVNRLLRFALPGEGSFASVPGRFGDVAATIAAGVTSYPHNLAGRVAALDGSVAPHDASSL